MSIKGASTGRREGGTVRIQPGVAGGRRGTYQVHLSRSGCVAPAYLGVAPAATQSFAVVVDDPDAPGGVFTHWVLFNIPSDNDELPEAISTEASLPNGALQGKNDFGEIGYGGPCPPPGRSHHYRFIVYALDQRLDQKAGITGKQLLSVMEGHILAQGQLTGTYQR